MIFRKGLMITCFMFFSTGCLHYDMIEEIIYESLTEGVAMNFKDAIEVLGEKGITFKVNPKTECVEFSTCMDGKYIRLSVRDEFDNILSEFCIDDYDQMVEVVERFADKEFFVPLQELKKGSTAIPDCEQCSKYENDINELEMEIRRLEDDREYKDDYKDRYYDLTYSMKNCF